MRAPTREPIALRLPLDVVKTLRQVKDREGVPITYQIEAALADWWQKKGFVKATSRRARTGRKV